jgi:hypothetical protein
MMEKGLERLLSNPLRVNERYTGRQLVTLGPEARRPTSQNVTLSLSLMGNVSTCCDLYLESRRE